MSVWKRERAGVDGNCFAIENPGKKRGNQKIGNKLKSVMERGKVKLKSALFKQRNNYIGFIEEIEIH